MFTIIGNRRSHIRPPSNRDELRRLSATLHENPEFADAVKLAFVANGTPVRVERIDGDAQPLRCALGVHLTLIESVKNFTFTFCECGPLPGQTAKVE
jgi:hypothetical protein